MKIKRITANLLIIVLALTAIGTTSISEAATYPAPELLEPTNGIVVTVNDLTFRWNPVPEGTNYMLLRTYSYGVWGNIGPSFIKETSWTLSKDELDQIVNGGETTFNWKVNAYAGPFTTLTPDSDIYTVNLLKIPGAWINKNDWNGVTENENLRYEDISTKNPLGSWATRNQVWNYNQIPYTYLNKVSLIWSDRLNDVQQKPVSFADHYRVQLSTSPEFDNPIIDIETDNIFYNTSELSPGAYYWRIRSETKNEILTEWNTPRKFLIAKEITITPTAKPTTKTTPTITTTPTVTATPTVTTTPTVTNVIATVPPTTPGFGIIATMVGLFALAFLAKRNNR